MGGGRHNVASVAILSLCSGISALGQDAAFWRCTSNGERACALLRVAAVLGIGCFPLLEVEKERVAGIRYWLRNGRRAARHCDIYALLERILPLPLCMGILAWRRKYSRREPDRIRSALFHVFHFRRGCDIRD